MCILVVSSGKVGCNYDGALNVVFYAKDLCLSICGLLKRIGEIEPRLKSSKDKCHREHINLSLRAARSDHLK